MNDNKRTSTDWRESVNRLIDEAGLKNVLAVIAESASLQGWQAAARLMRLAAEKIPSDDEEWEFMLVGRWNDNDAVLYHRALDRYELWTVAEDGTLTLDVPNDGRSYRFVREVTKFEIDDEDVIGSDRIQ